MGSMEAPENPSTTGLRYPVRSVITRLASVTPRQPTMARIAVGTRKGSGLARIQGANAHKVLKGPRPETAQSNTKAMTPSSVTSSNPIKITTRWWVLRIDIIARRSAGTIRLRKGSSIMATTRTTMLSTFVTLIAEQILGGSIYIVI